MKKSTKIKWTIRVLKYFAKKYTKFNLTKHKILKDKSVCYTGYFNYIEWEDYNYPALPRVVSWYERTYKKEEITKSYKSHYYNSIFNIIKWIKTRKLSKNIDLTESSINKMLNKIYK